MNHSTACDGKLNGHLAPKSRGRITRIIKPRADDFFSWTAEGYKELFTGGKPEDDVAEYIRVDDVNERIYVDIVPPAASTPTTITKPAKSLTTTKPPTAPAKPTTMKAKKSPTAAGKPTTVKLGKKPAVEETSGQSADFDAGSDPPVATDEAVATMKAAAADAKKVKKAKAKKDKACKKTKSADDDAEIEAAEQQALATALATGSVPPELSVLRREHFSDVNRGDLWEDLRTLPKISIQNYCQSKKHPDYSKAELEELRDEYNDHAHLGNVAQQIRDAYRLHGAEKVAASIATAVELGGSMGIDIALKQATDFYRKSSGGGSGYEMEDADALLEDPCEVQYLIPGMLMAGQPGIWGGLSKTMKTSLALMQAVCLQLGKDFLGSPVLEKVNVGIFSAESMRPVIRRTLQRIYRGMGLLDECGKKVLCDDRRKLVLNYSVPVISEQRSLDQLRETIKQHDLKVVYLDPAYMTLDVRTAERSSTVAVMGATLRNLRPITEEFGVSIQLLHHAAKTFAFNSDDPCRMEMLSGSGWQEFGRQFTLIERRKKFADAHEKHELVVRFCGNGGHNRLYAVTIDEGTALDDEDKRKWTATCIPYSEHQEAEAESAQTQKDADEAKEHHQRWSQLQLALADGPRTQNHLETKSLGWNRKMIVKWLNVFISEGRIETCIFTRNKRKYDGFRIAE